MKKLISLVIDTKLTDEQIEESAVRLLCRDTAGEDSDMVHVAHNVRVLDSGELDLAPKASESCQRVIGEALGLMNSMILSGEEHSSRSKEVLDAAQAALAGLK